MEKISFLGTAVANVYLFMPISENDANFFFKF